MTWCLLVQGQHNYLFQEVNPISLFFFISYRECSGHYSWPLDIIPPWKRDWKEGVNKTDKPHKIYVWNPFFRKKVCLYTFSVPADSLPSSLLHKIPEYTNSMDDYSLSAQVLRFCLETVQCWSQCLEGAQSVQMTDVWDASTEEHCCIKSLQHSLGFKLCWKGLTPNTSSKGSWKLSATCSSLTSYLSSTRLAETFRKDLKESHREIN